MGNGLKTIHAWLSKYDYHNGGKMIEVLPALVYSVLRLFAELFSFFF